MQSLQQWEGISHQSLRSTRCLCGDAALGGVATDLLCLQESCDVKTHVTDTYLHELNLSGYHEQEHGTDRFLHMVFCVIFREQLTCKGTHLNTLDWVGVTSSSSKANMTSTQHALLTSRSSPHFPGYSCMFELLLTSVPDWKCRLI
eukprot:2591795-Amphidinium_carterae.2